MIIQLIIIKYLNKFNFIYILFIVLIIIKMKEEFLFHLLFILFYYFSFYEKLI